MIGPIQRLSQCHRTITGDLSLQLLNTFDRQELSAPLSTKQSNTATQFPGDFVNFQISRISRRKNNSSRFLGFPGVLDTLFNSKVILNKTWIYIFKMCRHRKHLLFFVQQCYQKLLSLHRYPA